MPIRLELKSLANLEKARVLRRFFKTGKGEYAEGDIFLGIQVPQIRAIAKKYPNLELNKIQQLLNSKIHEERLIALLILSDRYKNSPDKEKIFNFYLTNIKNINNWDLVDLSAPQIIGAHLLNKDRKILYTLANSKNLWKKRISIVSTYFFIHNNDFQDAIKISQLLLNDSHDLIHKAVGWMLREVGKRDQSLLKTFLKQNYKNMPRTMLRYAIEKFPEEKRKSYLNRKIK